MVSEPGLEIELPLLCYETLYLCCFVNRARQNNFLIVYTNKLNKKDKCYNNFYSCCIHSIMQRRGRPRKNTPAAPAPDAPVGRETEQVAGSVNAPINQAPPGPAAPAEPAGGTFNAEQVAQILATAMRQAREIPEGAERSIERVRKLGAKSFDGSGDPESALAWLDRVTRIYGVMGCSDEQKVLFSTFLLEDRARDWWETLERRHPGGVSWAQFQKEFTDRFYP